VCDPLKGGTSFKLPLWKERAHVEVKTPDRHGAVRVEDVACKEISTKSHEHYLWIVSQIIFLPFCTEPDPTLRIRGNVYPEKNIG
jgi:hypothetical protein